MHPFSLLVKPVSGDCTLACRYCFYRGVKEYYPGSVHRMTPSTLAAMMEKYLALRFDVSSLCFQGGEPLLMDVDFYHALPELFAAHAVGGQSLEVSFQTNGIGINREWVNLFSRLCALVGVSLDGPEQLHDACRMTCGGDSTFGAVMKGIDCLRTGGIPFNILTMITDKSAGQADILYDFFLDEQFNWLQFIPCVEVDPVTGQLSGFSISGEEFERFYSSLFDRWFENGYPDVSIRLFEDILFHLVDGVNVACTNRKTCDGYLVVEYNGDVYPCDFFVTPEWKIGSVHDSAFRALTESPVRKRFMDVKTAFVSHCGECKYSALCNGGCPKHYLYSTVDTRMPNHLCRGYYRFLDHTWSRFLELRDDILKRRNA